MKFSKEFMSVTIMSVVITLFFSETVKKDKKYLFGIKRKNENFRLISVILQLLPLLYFPHFPGRQWTMSGFAYSQKINGTFIRKGGHQQQSLNYYFLCQKKVKETLIYNINI